MKLKNLSYLLTACIFVVACSNSTEVKEEETKEPGAGFDVANLDTTISPSHDFYMFTNGTWLANNPVPATESRWASFNVLMENNKKLLREILDDAAADATAADGSNKKKIGDFYASGMDTVAIEAAGLSHITADLERIASVTSKDELMGLVAEFQTYYMSHMFSFFPEQDLKNNTEIVPYLYQGGLGMPSRDYYLKDDASSVEIREAYLSYIQKLLVLSGMDESKTQDASSVILAMETKLAEHSRSRVDLRNSELNYNNLSLEELSVLAPAINWENYFTSMGVTDTKYIILNSTDFFKAFNDEYAINSLDNWKLYTHYHYVSSVASYLNADFRNAEFDFNEKVLNGTEEMKPRWKNVMESIDSFMGEALGEVYCQRAFTPETKERMMTMVNNLSAAFNDRIAQLDWMSDVTKDKAQHKLSTIINKIGYPDKWRDYSSLEIDRSSYLLNVKRAAAFEFQRNIDKIGKPVDKTEWGMSPQTVNAYYNPLVNEIVFPAGILQPPFFDPNADDALNYGAIGSVIGHEMTHGFDDQGRNFDADGNLKNWWTSEDSARFEDKAAMLVAQYSEYPVNDSLRVNGEFTLGENIADLGGLTIAYNAYLKSLEGNPAPEPIDGFTAEQRFFMGFAQVWRNNIRPEAAAKRILTDPHSPGMYRCNGVVSNLPEFYKAFDVKAGDAMHREETARAAIW